MKIFIVCPRLCHGGAERVGVVLADGFAAKGHQVVMATDLHEEITYRLDELVGVMGMTPATNSKIKKWGVAINRLRRYFRAHRPDVVIGIMPLCSLIARIAATGLHIPVIATEHDSFERPADAPMSKMEFFSKFCLNKIYRAVTILTAADQKVIGRRLRHAVVMPNPLSLQPIAGEEAADENVVDSIAKLHKQKVVLAAGRVDNWHYKGFDLLMRAWGKVMMDNSLKDWTLQIAGVWRNEQSKAFLETIARDAGCLDSVEFLGFQNDMLPVYQRSSVFVLSSRYEGFGLVLIEAMSQGCACVAADYKGRQSEIIQNEHQGITCAVEDADALAAGLRRMMSDETYRERAQVGAVRRSYFYSVSNCVKRWECLINKVVKNEQV